MPLNHILRKCTGGYKLHKSQEKINHLIYMDDIKMFAKIGDRNTGREDIQRTYRDRIWLRKMCHADNKKRKMTNDGRESTPQPKKKKKHLVWRKGNLQILENIGSGHYQTSGDERKNEKIIPQENEETTRNQTTSQKSQRNRN